MKFLLVLAVNVVLIEVSLLILIINLNLKG
jgi:hypothetical protein